ncbi:3-hydroxybutyrate dehydrogenase [Caulobacter ginsengisoli]|nr:3-hydroxybutyrate dehydrogenase [Caulobacter ginsengisoli]
MNTLARVAQLEAAPRPLEGRVALVTGSTSGIGLGVATELARQGAALVLNGLGDPDEIEQIRLDLARDHQVEATYSDADLRDPEAIRQMMAMAHDAIGPVDILVNNAGIQHVAPIEDFPVARWDAIIAINLTSAFHTIRAVLPRMKAEGYGRIINIASAHGLVGSPFKSAYVAAKHGVVGLTKVVALEAAESGVTCNAICPGYVWTPLVEQQIDDQAKAFKITPEQVIKDVLLKAQPNKRFATVEEIGMLTAYLCGPGGASITGAALPVDGAWTAH